MHACSDSVFRLSQCFFILDWAWSQNFPPMLFDYCDGNGFNDHPLFSVYNDAFQILLYYDEICNPLGSKTKIHKMGM